MTIGVIGLGLIGGSIAKAIKKYTAHTVLGCDLSAPVLDAAVSCKAIDRAIQSDELSLCDMTIVALYPKNAVEFIISNQKSFKKGSIVLDCCGVKQQVCSAAEPVAQKNGFYFVGGHPMAGIERSGFKNSFPEMFENASFILTPCSTVPSTVIDTISELVMQLGFGKIQLSTPLLHDQMIAYTSQLAHVVSCAYVTSPLAENFRGYSAGSFRDMTRVAKLNETMWTELFIENKDELCKEIDSLTERLIQLSSAIKTESHSELKQLLKVSRETKEYIDGEGGSNEYGH